MVLSGRQGAVATGPSRAAARALAALAACAAVSASAAAGAAAAAGTPAASPLTDRFALRASYFPASVSSSGRFDSDAGVPGTAVSGQGDFGFPADVTQGRVELAFRPAPRHRLRVDQLQLEQQGTVTVDRTIVFRNQTFSPGDRLESALDWRLIGFTWTAAIWRSESFEVAAGLGIHLAEAEASARVSARGIDEGATAAGALPSLALDGSWAFAPRWSVNARLQYLSVDRDEVRGQFRDYHLDVQYRWRPSIAIGLGWSRISLDAEASDTDLPGRLSISARGPEAFFRVSF